MTSRSTVRILYLVQLTFMSTILLKQQVKRAFSEYMRGDNHWRYIKLGGYALAHQY
jgi:hypothetical protein